MEKLKFLDKENISRVPQEVGVYVLKTGDKFLYIGKAINLQERIKNHFQRPTYRDNLFIDQVKKIGFIKTDSEIEALILEASLIRKHEPKYNIVWRDDKNYFFVGKTQEDFPQIFITHQKKPDNNYVGPFVDGKSLKQTLKLLRKVFPFRTCKTLPKRPCLWYQLDRCPAPCILETGAGSQIPSARDKIKKEVKSNIRSILNILRGQKHKVLKDLKREMELASKKQDFEKASNIRDKIFALEKVISHSGIIEEKLITEEWDKTEKELKNLIGTTKEISKIEAYDISNIQGQESTGSMVTFVNGLPDKNLYRKFRIKISGKPNDVAMLKEVIKRRLTHREWPYPDLILVDGGISQFNATKSVVKNKKIPVVSIAKRENKLFVKGGRQFFLKNLSREIFNLILQLRDEAHRFAITYHKKLRKIKTFH